MSQSIDRDVFPGTWKDVYHTYRFCSGRDFDPDRAIPESEAVERGLEKCPKCDSMAI